jgi:AcrR family transcriptional regulator
VSPRSAAANRSVRDATRTRLIATGLRLFADRGYASTPVSAIARAAGVSQGLLYHYFPGKTELLTAIFETSVADVRESWAAADAEPDPANRLPILLRTIGRLIRERREFWALTYGVRMQREVLETVAPLLGTWVQEIQEKLRLYLRDAGWPDADMEALLLFAQIDGVSQHFVLDTPHYPLDAVIDKLIERYRSATPTRAHGATHSGVSRS